MVIKGRQVDRECVTGAMVLICIVVIILSSASIWFFDVKVSNIELVDRGLYTVITDKGPINVGQDDILRIERSYTKAAITGTPVELAKIYTTKGFIYFSSLDSFAKTGRNLLILSITQENLYGSYPTKVKQLNLSRAGVSSLMVIRELFSRLAMLLEHLLSWHLWFLLFCRYNILHLPSEVWLY